MFFALRAEGEETRLLATKEKYAARAVELLRQAVAKGYKDAAS